MLGLYVLGFLMAVLTARLLKSSILKSGRTPFLLEMPSYRWPTLQSLGLRLLDRAKVFLVRAGTVILLVSVLLWCAQILPYTNGHPPELANSLAGTFGRTIEPIIKPLGFNWKIGIGLITAVFSRARPSSPRWEPSTGWIQRPMQTDCKPPSITICHSAALSRS